MYIGIQNQFFFTAVPLDDKKDIVKKLNCKKIMLIFSKGKFFVNIFMKIHIKAIQNLVYLILSGFFLLVCLSIGEKVVKLETN